MVRAVVELLEALLRALSHSGDLLSRALPNLLRLVIRVFEAATLPEVLLLFVLAVGLTALLVLLQAGCHLAISALSGRKARVFISYHHSLENIANELAAAMLRSSIAPTLLPFATDPDHDELLERVKRAIGRADVVICLPGSRSSFVENEVAMAFALSKPLLFVLDPADHPRLPNTAKKGYPLFDREALRRDGWLPLARFASYLAADLRSTLRLYGAVIEHLKACAAFAALAFGVSIVMGTAFIEPSPAVQPSGHAEPWLQAAVRGIAHPATGWFLLIGISIFLVPYLVFFLTRSRLRSEVRRAISGHRFDARLLPDTLQLGLSRADLERVRFRGAAAPEHEAAPSTPREVRVGLNRGKLVFHILAAVAGGTLLLSCGPFVADGSNLVFDLAAVLLGILGLLVLFLGASLARILVRGGQLSVSSEGIVDPLNNRHLGLVRWEEVSRVGVDADLPSLKLKVKDRYKPVEVELVYYRISPDALLSLVLERLGNHRIHVRTARAPREAASQDGAGRPGAGGPEPPSVGWSAILGPLPRESPGWRERR